MTLAFSSIISGLRSFLRSSHANQNRMFSSLYSCLKKERKTFRPPEQINKRENVWKISNVSDGWSLTLTFAAHESLESVAPGFDLGGWNVPKNRGKKIIKIIEKYFLHTWICAPKIRVMDFPFSRFKIFLCCNFWRKNSNRENLKRN